MHVHKLSKYITYYTHINPTSHISLTIDLLCTVLCPTLNTYLLYTHYIQHIMNK